MASTTYAEGFVGIFKSFSNLLTEKIKLLGETYTTQYGNDMSTLFSSAVVIYIVYVGYQHMAGKKETPVVDLAWDLTKFCILLMFITNAGGWLTLVADTARSIREGFAGGTDIWSSLDRFSSKLSELGTQMIKQDKTRFHIGGYVGQLPLYAGGILLTVVAASVLLISELTMEFMLLTAPIFIFCNMWGFLREMFNNWLKTIFSSILTVLFVSLVIDLCISYMEKAVETILQGLTGGLNMYLVGAQVCGGCCLAVALIFAAKSMAAAISSVNIEGAIAGSIKKTAPMSYKYTGTKALVGGTRKILGKVGDTAYNNFMKNDLATVLEAKAKRK